LIGPLRLTAQSALKQFPQLAGAARLGHNSAVPYWEVAELLITEGADIHNSRRVGEIPLDLAKRFKAGDEIIDLLKKQGAKE